MGNYFAMSFQFNKGNASDFGFIAKDENTAIDPKDDSVWIKCALFDFGWGKENGFYKVPLPGFGVLFDLVLHSENRDDMFGAAAVILEKYADDLLCQCEKIMNDRARKEEFKRLVEVFNLKLPTNRSSVVQKTYAQIQNDYRRWKTVSEKAMKI